MVDQGTNFISQTAPQLFGDAAQAIGGGIRQGLIDMTNPLRGEDSEIFGMLADGAKFLAQNAPDLFISVGQAAVKGILNGFQGLVQGLVGAEEGAITTALKDAASGVGVGMFTSVGGDIMSSIKGGIQGGVDLGQAIIGSISLPSFEDVKTGVSGFGSAITGTVGALIDEAGGLGAAIIGSLSVPSIDDIKDGLDGLGSAIIDAIGGLVEDAAGFGSIIKEKIVSAINSGISTLNDLTPTVKAELPQEDKSLPGPLPGIKEGSIIDSTIIGDDPFPKLRSGGLVEEAGLAEIHEGEQVVPAAEVDRDAPTSGPKIVIEKVVADSRRGGRQAAKALKEEMRRHDLG
jgi:hypothetical protein